MPAFDKTGPVGHGRGGCHGKGAGGRGHGRGYGCCGRTRDGQGPITPQEEIVMLEEHISSLRERLQDLKQNAK